jgi:hypothetical protein
VSPTQHYARDDNQIEELMEPEEECEASDKDDWQTDMPDARLHIPVFRNLFSGPKKPVPARIPEDFCFFLCFPEEFSTGTWFLEVVPGIPVFCCFHGNFSQEFLWDRNSCIYSGFLLIPPDSSGFLFLPNAVLLWPATKVRFLISKYQLK